MLRSEGFDEGEGGWERPRLVSTPESEGVKELDRRADRLEGETRVVAGVLNAGFGRLVEVTAEIIADPRGLVGCGVHTPAAWLAWHAGLSRGQGRNVERLARRVVELPDTVAALVAGELSLDQASVIARYVPANFEASACDVAKMCTVAQLRRTLPNYSYDADENPDANPKDKADAERSMSCGTDGKGWWGRMRMPLDEGAAFEAAMAAKRDQLFKARQDQDGDDAVAVTNVDGLLAMAESALADLDARLPGTDRYIVNLHLEANPDTDEGSDDDPDADSSDDVADAAILWLHQRGAVDRATHRFLTCDCRIRARLYKNGTPYSSGATRRLVNRPLRRQVEQRDKGCVIPGCAALRGLEVHHIRHWEDGGPTVSSNLVTVCRRHHRAHHHGHVNICGNPDLPTGTCGALEFADGNGKPMPPGPVPTPPELGTDLAHAARTAGLPDAVYVSPLNEHLDTRDFWLNPTPDQAPDPAAPPEPEAPPAASHDWDKTDHHPPPGGTTDPNSSSDPTRAGPSAA